MYPKDLSILFFGIYDYNYNLVVYEERYNVVNFIGGNCGLLYAT